MVIERSKREREVDMEFKLVNPSLYLTCARRFIDKYLHVAFLYISTLQASSFKFDNCPNNEGIINDSYMQGEARHACKLHERQTL